jgi:hypothetical protein
VLLSPISEEVSRPLRGSCVSWLTPERQICVPWPNAGHSDPRERRSESDDTDPGDQSTPLDRALAGIPEPPHGAFASAMPMSPATSRPVFLPTGTGRLKVQKALEAAMRARSKRTEVTADHVVAELARIGFANVRDYWPKQGGRSTCIGSIRTVPQQSRRSPSTKPSTLLACFTGAPV